MQCGKGDWVGQFEGSAGPLQMFDKFISEVETRKY
jgi:hypothetical protein